MCYLLTGVHLSESYELIKNEVPDFGENHFTEPIKKTVWGIMENLYKSNGLEYIKFQTTLMNKGIYQDYSKLQKQVIGLGGSGWDVVGAIRSTHEAKLRRDLITTCMETMAKANDPETDIFDLCDAANTGISEMTSIATVNEYTGEMLAKEAYDEEMRRMDVYKEKGAGAVTGVTTGLDEYDKLLSGWQNSTLNIIAARPGMGKTALVICLAISALRNGYGVGILSDEMSALELTNRMICVISGLNSDKIRDGSLTDEEFSEYESAISEIENFNIHVEDSSNKNIYKIERLCKKWVKSHGVKLILGDYLQLHQTDGKEKRDDLRIKTIAQKMKGISKTLKIPVVELAQLNRAVETRGGDKRPMLSDLGGGSGIEEAADTITFIYRPEYYGIMEDDKGSSTGGVAELIVKKHRGGRLGVANVKWIGDLTKFDNQGNDLDFGEKEFIDNKISSPPESGSFVPF